MKKYFYLVFGLVLVQFSCEKTEHMPSQNDANNGSQDAEAIVIKPSLEDFVPIQINATGYNLKFPGREEPWQRNSPRNFLQGLLDSEANMIRYPGGTCTSFWNFHTDKMLGRYVSNDPDGWVNAKRINSDLLRNLVENDEQKINSVNDLKHAVKSSGSRVVFVMNMVTPGNTFYAQSKGWDNPNPGTNDLNNDWYKMLEDRYERFKSMLLRAKGGTDPIDIQFIELGNEYYFGGDDIANSASYYVEAFPTATEYAIAAKYIANKLKNDTDLNLHPNVKIAAVACHVPGKSNRLKQWNSKLKTELDKPNGAAIGYVTLHTYELFEQPATYTESNFQNKLVEWYGRVNSKYNPVIEGGSNADIFVNSGYGIWYTELSPQWEGGMSGVKDRFFTWGQCLMDAYSAVHLLDRGKAGMYLQYKFDGIVKTNDEAGNGKHVYHRALALLPLMKASKAANKAARVSFAGTEIPKLPSSPKAVVQGYCFSTPAGVKSCAIINLSATSKQLDLRNIYTDGTLTLESWHQDLANLGETAEPIFTTATKDVSEIRLKPFSVTYIH